MRIVITSALIAAVAALAAGSAASGVNSGYFKTADNSIWCIGTAKSGVQCGIKGGTLKPKPKKHTCKGIDPVYNRLGFGATGKASVTRCAGDAGPFGNPKATKVLKAGKTWKAGGSSCTATRSSMTCKNKSGHGFTVSRASYRLF